jgi:hypothetical protein
MTVPNYREWLLNHGYLDADETKRRLLAFRAAGVPYQRVAKLAGIPISTAHVVARGRQKTVRREHADRIATLSITEARACMIPYVDPVLIDRILSGKPSIIPYGDKKVYARALYARGWSTARIGKTLAMSGQSIREALSTNVKAT